MYSKILPIPSESSLDENLFSCDCTIPETEALLRNVKCGTATGPDRITALMLRTFSEGVSPSICSIVNHSIRTGKLPSNWKLSNVVPLPKETSLCHDVRLFRPISLLSIIRKCPEKHLFQLLIEHFEQNSVLSDYQFGFRSGHSTMISLLISVFDWQQSLKRKQQVLCVFMDIKKAFDSVPHQALLNKFSSLNIHFIMHRWLTIYLQGYNVLSLVVSSPRGSQLSQVFLRTLSWGPCVLCPTLMTWPLSHSLMAYRYCYLLMTLCFSINNNHQDTIEFQADVDLVVNWAKLNHCDH